MVVTLARSAVEALQLQLARAPNRHFDPVLDSADRSTAASFSTVPTPPQQLPPPASYPYPRHPPTRPTIGPPQPALMHRILAPAPPRTAATAPAPKRTDFFDLPAELRIEVYKLVLDRVVLHILPLHDVVRHCPHALVLASRQVRNEVLPLMHSTCQVRATVTDFNFGGLLAWVARIPPDQQALLCKNGGLTVRLCTSMKPAAPCDHLRKWLHLRADPHRPQPLWQYTGPTPKNKVANDMKRRYKRMPEEGKRREMAAMMSAIGIRVP
ncbi:hypothetical protein LTR08_000321 [Meristemomyces frigidus]|nr:hypothetical protein LTR08_000321 [Meristemomyces frigidus]